MPFAMSGRGETSFRADYGRDAATAFPHDTVVIDAGDAPNAPIWITSDDPGDRLLVVQVPYRPVTAPARREAAA